MAAASPASTHAAADKRAGTKPERPDEEAFHKAETAAKKANEDAQTKLNEIWKKLDLTKPGNANKNPRQQELKNELAEIRALVAEKKGTRQKAEEHISAFQDSINARVKELNAKKNGIRYRTLADLEAAVAKLEKDIESGKMKIVDEKRALQEINTLNRQKKNFGDIETAQKNIDADYCRLKELKEQKQDPVLKELNDKYAALDKEFKEIKAEQDSVYENLKALRDERTRLQAIQQEKWQALKKLQDDFYQGRNAYRAYEREARKFRDERRAREQAEYLLGKKRAAAAEKLEKASVPVFAEQIITCESLIAFFDPSSAEAARKAKLAAAPRELAAKATRDVKPLGGKKLIKEEEDYFVGTGGKKKGKKSRAAPTKEDSETAPAASTKFNLNVGLLEELAKVDVPTPASAEDVPHVLEKLREKLQYYKDNQDKVTQANIAKAQKEIDRLEKEGEEPAEAEASPAPAYPAAVEPLSELTVATSWAQQEEKEEEETGAASDEEEKAEEEKAGEEKSEEENAEEEKVEEEKAEEEKAEEETAAES